MNLEENVTNGWSSLHHVQLPNRPSFIERFIRLKTTYWNKGYALVLLGIIGLSITTLQFNTYFKFIEFMEQANKLQTENSRQDCISYNYYGFMIGLIPGGVLATLYPAHNILGIFIALSSTGHLIGLMGINYINTLTLCILQFFVGIATAVVEVSIYRVWTYWVPLNKQSIRHVPIVLYFMILNGGYLFYSMDKLHNEHSSYTLTLFIGMIGLAWYVLWLYVINGKYSFRSLNHGFILFGGSNNSRYSFGTYSTSLTRSIVSDIPWKSICTSKPLLVIGLLYVCSARLTDSYAVSDLYGDEVLEWNMRNYTIIVLLLFVALVELVPEITVNISTTYVRKFWSCSYFGLMGILFILEAILGNTIRTEKLYQYLFKEMHYLYNFGFYVNTLDIAPKYASLLSSLVLSLHYDTLNVYCDYAVFALLSFVKVRVNEVETAILATIICFAAAVLYAIFASAELQPWADEPVEENQQNMVEYDNKL